MSSLLPESLEAAVAPLSDVDGRIRHVFFALPAYVDEVTLPILSCIAGIRAALGADVRCTVLHHPGQTAAVQDALAHLGPLDAITWQQGFVLRMRDTQSRLEGKTLRVTKMALPDFTNWVQDAFLVATDRVGGRRIWASPHVQREFGGWDHEVARLLAAQLDWPCSELPMGVEGGNVLIDHRSVLVGSDVTASASSAEWQMLVDRLSAGQRSVLVCIPGHEQPVFHLDLYVTLAGAHLESGQPLALVGSIQLASALLGRDGPADAIEVELDASADYLASHGYRIVRLPLLPHPASSLPKRAYYSYNNCLVEIWQQRGETRRRVTLPAYADNGGDKLATLDAAAVRIWEGLGFEVGVARGEFGRVAELYGSVRCMTKVLGRDPM